MILIQPLLILGLIASTLIYFSSRRSRLLDRLVVLTFAFAGIVMVAFPGSTTWLAHRLGVGRGVDLVIYLGLVTIGFLISLIFSKIRALEANLTKVIREIALSGVDSSAMSARIDTESPRP